MDTRFARTDNDSPSRCFFRSGIHAVTFPGRTPPVPRRVGGAAPARGRVRGVARFLRGGTRTGEVRPDALEDVARRRLPRPAAAVQGGAGVPEPEVRAPLAHGPRSG